MDFNKRFNIQIEEKELHKRFLNRFENQTIPLLNSADLGYKFSETVTKYVATRMGIRYSDNRYIGSYPEGNFYRCLQLLEFVHDYFNKKFGSNHKFGKHIQILLALDEGSDIEWYLTSVEHDLGFIKKEIINLNDKKLTKRDEKGLMHGSGDHRENE